MHIIEVFGRIFISALFIIEAVKKFFNPDISMMYMSDHGVPEFLFYPSIAFELIVPLLLIAGYKTKIIISVGFIRFIGNFNFPYSQCIF